LSLLLMGAGGSGGAAGGGGEPPTLENIQVWYDGQDAETLWSDTAGTTPLTDGGTAARWDDKSGNARHVTQATSTKRPIWTEATGYVTFDGTDDCLDINGPSIAMPLTMYFVMMRTAGGVGAQRHAFDSDQSIANERVRIYKGASEWTESNYNAGNINSAAVWPTDTLHVFSFTYNGASSTIHRNGTLVSGVTTIAGTGNVKLLRIGDVRGAGGLAFFGSINEALIYTGVHDQATREAFEAYLIAKWGIV
jgi:hypothetical protein